jgi:hypothetical protein
MENVEVEFSFMSSMKKNKKGKGKKWFLDSGASEHLCADESEMEHIEPLKDIIRIKTAKTGEYLLTKKKGNLKVTSVVKGEE